MISGYASSEGTEKYNMALSLSRAKQVKTALLETVSMNRTYKLKVMENHCR